MKKVLSIVLSVAMVICLMPAMAFAADSNSTAATGLSKFSDASSITNKEAVSVLAGLGVINGKGDGTFDPKGDVTRAETSTLVSILVRSGDSSSLSAPSKDPFTDVAKDNWAAPYVAYGVSQGYLNGRGDGTFDPTGNVTTAQLATILEQILGYSKTDVAYQWPENAMAYATTSGLLTGISKGANENLDREEAAQMIFNALKATDVVKGTVTGENGSTGYSAVTNKASQDYMDRSATKGDKNYSDEATTEQLVEKLFPKVTCGATDADNFGRISTAWKNGRTQISDDVTETPAYTYTAAQTEKALNSDLKGYTLKNVPVYSNNKESDSEVNSVSEIADLTGNGVLVELYTNAKDTAITNVVVVSYELDTVKSVKSGSDASITLDSGEKNNTIKSTDSFFSAVSSAAKGDKVLVARQDESEAGAILDAYLPTTVTGTVSAATASTATIAGTTYSYAKDVANLKESTGKNLNVYLDKYGYICGSDAVKTTQTAANWIYVTGVRETETTDPYAGANADKTYEVTIVGVDESGNVVTGQKVAKLTTTKDGSTTVLPTTDATGKVTTALRDSNISPGSYYAYKETANGYELSNTDALSSVKPGSSTAVPANAKQIGTDVVATDVKTVTVSGTASKTTATVANGLSAIPAGSTYSYVIKNELVETVFVTNVAPAESAVYISDITTGGTATYTDKDGATQVGTVVTYYTAGSADKQTMTVSPDTNVKLEANKFYTATANGTGYVVKLASDQGTSDVTVTKVYNGGVMLSGDSVLRTVADGAIRDTRTDDKALDTYAAITSLDALQTAVADKYKVTVTYKTDSTTGNVTQMYITDVTAPAPTSGN